MISTYTTNFIGSDGVDLGSKLLTREYFNNVYLNIANQYITPELWVWGFNEDSQLGTNSSQQKSCVPVTTFAGGSNWKQISCGFRHTCAIKTDGTLWTWGENDQGQLGDNTATNRCTPVTTFAGGNNWKYVNAGRQFTAAIKTDGTLWTWGSGGQGRLGTNNIISRSTPVTTFAGGNNWKQVSCGEAHTSVVKTDGTLWVWGANSYSQLGDNTATNRCTPVTTFAGGNDWKQVSVGNRYSASVKTDGTLWVWGSNTTNVLGTNSSAGAFFASTPITTFAGGTDWKQVSAGGFHVAAIKTNGTLWTWGYGGDGSLGTNRVTTVSTPVTTFAGGNNWRQVDAVVHTSAIKTDGTLWVWGNNENGELGNGSNTNVRTPIPVFFGGNNWGSVLVSCGSSHTAAIRSYDD
jgi:alpha-tubulin suppressor-like RCC1 family protein